jgi:hypothetical protein
MKSIIATLAVMALLYFLAGCGGETTPTGPDNGGSDGQTDTRTVKADPSLSSDIWEIFTRTGCSSVGCHGGGAGSLTLDQASTLHSRLVNVSSTGGETLVIPNDTLRSYFLKRIDGRVNPRMPLNRSALDNIDLTNVKNWISQGAKNN